MTATTVSSGVITNALTNTTAVTYNALGSRGDARAKVVTGTMEVATTSIDETGDIVLLFPCKGTDRLTSLVLFNDDLDVHATPTLAVDVGIYKDVNVAGTSATVVDADALGSAITTLQAANTTGVEVRFEAADINGINKAVWELGGESAATAATRYIGLTVTTGGATATAGTLSWRATLVSA